MTEALATIVFREACESDLGALQSFVDELYSGDSSTAHVCADINLTFKEFVQFPEKGRIIAFCSEEQLIGYCIIIFFWSNEYRGNIIEVDEIYIIPPRRGEGICSKLFAWLEDAYAKQLTGFSLQVSANNESAMAAIRKLGFTLSRNQHLIRILE